jgi:hypothetical protein
MQPIHNISARNLYVFFYNPNPMAKYGSSSLVELLDLLVFHQLKLNQLLTLGQFRNKKYMRHRRSVALIQDAIKSISDRSDKND